MRRSIPIQFNRELPNLPLVSDVAKWLDIPVGLLDWLSKHRKVHYRLRCLRKKSGGLRLLESPRMRLKIVQRQINREILQRIPCHDAAHGFVPGRSPLTVVDQHVGKCVARGKRVVG